MNRSIKIVRRLIISLAVLFILLYGLSFTLSVTSGQHEFTSKFKSIKLETPINNAVRLLGEPTEITTVFRLGQREGYEQSYFRAENSGSAKYYIWSCCIDMTYTLGINTKGKIVLAEYGGT